MFHSSTDQLEAIEPQNNAERRLEYNMQKYSSEERQRAAWLSPSLMLFSLSYRGDRVT